MINCNLFFIYNNYSDYLNNTEKPKEKEIIESFEMKTYSYQFFIGYLFKEWDLYKNNSQIMNIISKGYFCIDNLGKGGIFSPEKNLRKCRRAKYFGNNDTYECTECLEGYALDDGTKVCKQSITVSMNLRPGISNCYAKNIGNKSNPIYSCVKCNKHDDLLITSDTGAKFCESKSGELAGCSEVYADTTYLNNVIIVLIAISVIFLIIIFSSKKKFAKIFDIDLIKKEKLIVLYLTQIMSSMSMLLLMAHAKIINYLHQMENIVMLVIIAQLEW